MPQEMNYGEDYKYIPQTSIESGIGREVLADLYMYTTQIANVFFVGSKDRFVIVDAGMPRSREEIISEVEQRFSEFSKPEAIVLTHGHFDHVGGIIEMVEKWNVPVYAHSLELPYLTGKKSYPKPDATVEGGMVAKMSPMFPREPINLGSHVQPLPDDGSVPHMEGFRWIHTPGHTPGHVSFFRDSDGTLIAGDAFITVRQDSLYKVMTQKKEVHGPPRYLTTDWKAAKKSVEKLHRLNPALAVTGHGLPVSDEALAKGLEELVYHFDELAVPDHGRYVDDEPIH